MQTQLGTCFSFCKFRRFLWPMYQYPLIPTWMPSRTILKAFCKRDPSTFHQSCTRLLCGNNFHILPTPFEFWILIKESTKIHSFSGSGRIEMSSFANFQCIFRFSTIHQPSTRDWYGPPCQKVEHCIFFFEENLFWKMVPSTRSRSLQCPLRTRKRSPRTRGSQYFATFCILSIFCIFNIVYFVNILCFVNILQLENRSNS